ncbi:MAG: hypothetical protein PVH88_21690 [Ignavibacteria bacterium]|jgi:hypothetical protein
MKMIFAMRNKKSSLKIFQEESGEYLAVKKFYLLGRFVIRTLRENIKEYDDVEEKIQLFKSETMYDDFYSDYK